MPNPQIPRRALARMPQAILVLALIGFAERQPGLAQAPSSTSLIHAGRVLNVRDGQYLPDAGILVKDGTIVEVGPFPGVRAHAPDAPVVDLTSAVVLPGLIDCHTHLLMTERMQTLVEMSTAERALLGASTARDALAAGVTTVRDVGNSSVNGDVALRNGIRAGWITGSRILASTRALSPVGASSIRWTRRSVQR